MVEMKVNYLEFILFFKKTKLFNSTELHNFSTPPSPFKTKPTSFQSANRLRRLFELGLHFSLRFPYKITEEKNCSISNKTSFSTCVFL